MNKKSRIKDIINKTIFVEEEEEEEVAADVKVKTTPVNSTKTTKSVEPKIEKNVLLVLIQNICKSNYTFHTWY